MQCGSLLANYAPLITALGTLVGAFGAVSLGQWIARHYAKKATDKRDAALLGSLIAEIEHCGELADMYVSGQYLSPAYRLHHKIYENALPTLAASALSPDDVDKLISFYTHVDQVNWGLDEVDRLRKLPVDPNLPTSEQGKLLEQEANRLFLKASDTQQPDGKFYKPVRDALLARLKERTE